MKRKIATVLAAVGLCLMATHLGAQPAGASSETFYHSEVWFTATRFCQVSGIHQTNPFNHPMSISYNSTPWPPGSCDDCGNATWSRIISTDWSSFPQNDSGYVFRPNQAVAAGPYGFFPLNSIHRQTSCLGGVWQTSLDYDYHSYCCWDY